MNRRVSVAEAKNKLPSIIHEVEEGAIIEITRYGKAVAMVISERDYRRMREIGQGFWVSLRKVRSLLSSGGVTIDEGDFRDLRDTSPARSFVWPE